MKLIVNEIFTSIDGEVNAWGQGCFSTFVRLAGCNIRCSYCDTEKALLPNAGTEMEEQQVAETIARGGCKKVTITGGEPLVQREAVELLIEYLAENGFKVSIETNGTLPVKALAAPVGMVNWIVDYKLPSSGMAARRMSDAEFVNLPKGSWVKFVIATEEDWNETCRFLALAPACLKIALSPCMGTPGAISPEELISRCVEDKMFNVVINCQIHKFLLPTGEDFAAIK